MEKTVRTMTGLIAYEVCGKGLDTTGLSSGSGEELARLEGLARAHDLAHLVGDALLKNDLLSDEEIRAKYEKQRMLALYRYEKIRYELDRLREAFNAAKIEFIPLKGAVLREYYPEPWMRTSCDIDILVHEGDLCRAEELLSGGLAYRKDSKGSHDVGFYSDGGVHIELHYSLIEENCVGKAEKVLESVWEKASSVGESCEYLLDGDMFYYYHIAHMAKHFVSTGGCGMRPVLDLWVLDHRVGYDRESRERLLDAGGLLAFSRGAEALSEVWFGDGTHTDITRQMEDYILRGGAYGTVKGRVAVQQVKRGGKFRYALSRIWIPYDSLRFYYPSLEGKKALLPVYEARRWCGLIFRGGAKRGIEELRLNSATSDAGRENTKKMLSRLGLDD